MSTADRGELPLPDYDQLPVGALEHRIRALSGEQIDQLVHYEHAHADRPMVVQVLTARKHQLEQGATPSGGDPGAFQPEHPGKAQAGSPVSPSGSPQPIHPPPHGTPFQSGKPKGNMERP
ncbi:MULTISPECIES: hypothetical protein [unclassified Streptomyces]|uniref:hypothetical protein n=1 Tax=unclassified Streptomyces TaxID=2593676 RepID=UPI0033AE1C9A